MGYKLPKSLRASLRDPIGEIFTGSALNAAKNAKEYINAKKPKITVSIGDYCTKTLFDVHFLPDIVIYDGKTLREEKINLKLDLYQNLKAFNPPEWISDKAWKILESTIKQIQSYTSGKCRVAVRIDGEEDLLVIPAIILLPLGSMVIYGQPPIATDEGIVCTFITLSVKHLMEELLSKFETHEVLINGDNNCSGKI